MDSIIIDTFGEIKNGKLSIYDKELFLETLENSEDCKVELILKIRTGTVTNQMRRYYFGSLLREVQRAFFAAGQELGIDEIDYTFRMKALYKEVYSAEQARMVREPHSLKDDDTEVTTLMMSYYFEYIIRFTAQNLNWSVAFPNEILQGEDLTENQIQALLKRK